MGKGRVRSMPDFCNNVASIRGKGNPTIKRLVQRGWVRVICRLADGCVALISMPML